MRRVELLRFAAGAIAAHPMRSALTALGVVIGVAAVVMMTSIGLGAQKQVTSAISGLGTNLIVITPAFGRPGAAGPARQAAGADATISGGDADAIRAQVEGVIAVSAAVRGQQQVVAEGTNWNTRVEGVTPEYLVARDLGLSGGRMFDDAEAKQGKKVAILGATPAKELFPEGNPVGQRIRIGAVPFDVIGILTAKGQSGFGQDQDDLIVAPLQAVRSRVVGGRRFRGDSVQQIYVKAGQSDDLTRIQEDVTNLMRDRHKIRPGDADDFQVQNLASILEASQAATQTFTVLLAAVAAVSLVVGGVGIMNIMLVAVTERTREIGLRMALGARRSDVLFQFALEAITLSVAGGVIGLLIGWGGAALMAFAGKWPIAVAGWAAPLSIGFSLLVGLVFGAYPSWRAAQLDPIEALRRE
ncbi:MAG TPA: ABC transporter permease [Caulobacteraceae bacterium]|jgi:putative ABC transport system permease protein|nr:ABC transporter permease [Caulobacteraceae bacterium]